MTKLLLGLLLFLGVHSVRIFAEGLRTWLRQRIGADGYKGLYSVLSLAGFALIVWGYGQARLTPTVLWPSPGWTRHAASLLTLASFILLVAAYVPRNGIKLKVGHPMVIGVKIWAAAHLLANNTLADLVLFGSFLAWAVLDLIAARRRDRAAAAANPPPPLGPGGVPFPQVVVGPDGSVKPLNSVGMNIVVVLVGVMAWMVFAFWGHGALIGVRPFALSVG
jgi:uncharacterized membrane protein